MSKPMTQEQVENFIQLAGQTGERWFSLRFIDEDMNSDPTAAALMEAIADAIHDGIMSAAFIGMDEKPIIMGAHDGSH